MNRLGRGLGALQVTFNYQCDRLYAAIMLLSSPPIALFWWSCPLSARSSDIEALDRKCVKPDSPRRLY